MALVVKELTDELEKLIWEKCRKNGHFVSFYSYDVVVDDERDIMFIPGCGRGSQDEPCSLSMFYGKTKSRIIYEDHSSGFLLTYDVVQISNIPSDLEKNQVFELISDYFECDTKNFNDNFAKNNPNAELYRVKVKFDRCKIYEK